MNNVSTQHESGDSDEEEEEEEEEEESEEEGEDNRVEDGFDEPADNEPGSHRINDPADEAGVPSASARSRSPSRDSDPSHSRSPSPSSLADRTAALSLSPSDHAHTGAKHRDDGPHIKEKVHSEVSKRRAREVRKYHSKKGTQRIGRPKGSKAKQDARVKVDGGGFWD